MPRQRERDRTANYSFRINYLRSYSIRGTGRSPGQVANSQYSAGMTFTESLGIADATNREMWETIYRAPFDGSIVTHKTLYLIGLIDLALEHQAAINLLIRQKHPGSAMALVRSVIEAMYKGAWVIAKASETDAEKIRQEFRVSQLQTAVRSGLVRHDDVRFPLEWYVQKRMCLHKKLLLAYMAENSTIEAKQFFESLDNWQRCSSE